MSSMFGELNEQGRTLKIDENYFPEGIKFIIKYINKNHDQNNKIIEFPNHKVRLSENTFSAAFEGMKFISKLDELYINSLKSENKTSLFPNYTTG